MAGAIRQAFLRGRSKAAGPDGWSGAELCLLPDAALDRLCSVLDLVERCQQWPAGLDDWRVAFIPKPHASG
eukprot:627433-Alexandrium_andersonii.AAC.1